MKKLAILALAVTALIGGALVSPLSAQNFQVVDFSQAATWNAANPDITMFSAGDGPITFNDVLGVAGCTVTLDFAGTYTSDGSDIITGTSGTGGLDNRVDEGTNTWTVTFGSATNFLIEQRTHHGPDEINTLTVGGGSFDPATFAVTGDTASPSTAGGLPAPMFSAGDTMASIGPYGWNTGDANTGGAHPEWSLEGMGTSFTFTQDTTNPGDGNNNGNNNTHRNRFRFSIDADTHTAGVPEPSSVSLIALGMLGLVSRRRR